MPLAILPPVIHHSPTDAEQYSQNLDVFEPHTLFVFDFLLWNIPLAFDVFELVCLFFFGSCFDHT